MTRREAAIVMAYTGIAIGDFSVFHGYAEEKLRRAVWTHEFASERVAEALKEASREDFIGIEVSG